MECSSPRKGCCGAKPPNLWHESQALTVVGQWEGPCHWLLSPASAAPPGSQTEGAGGDGGTDCHFWFPLRRDLEFGSKKYPNPQTDLKNATGEGGMWARRPLRGPVPGAVHSSSSSPGEGLGCNGWRQKTDD